MLAEVYGGPNNTNGNGYMYHYLLDEMMRRGQIDVSAAAKVLMHAQSGGTHLCRSTFLIASCLCSSLLLFLNPLLFVSSLLEPFLTVSLL